MDVHLKTFFFNFTVFKKNIRNNWKNTEGDQNHLRLLSQNYSNHSLAWYGIKVPVLYEA